MTPLQQLIDSVQTANDWSLRDIEKRASAGHAPISKSRIAQLKQENPLGNVTLGNIYGLAAGLGISPTRVAIAAIQSMGFNVSAADITPAEAIARDETLSDDTKRALLAILHAPRREGVRGA